MLDVEPSTLMGIHIIGAALHSKAGHYGSISLRERIHKKRVIEIKARNSESCDRGQKHPA